MPRLSFWYLEKAYYSNQGHARNRLVTLFKKWPSFFHGVIGDIYSWLSRFSTARGSCTGLVTVGPTKV